MDHRSPLTRISDDEESAARLARVAVHTRALDDYARLLASVRGADSSERGSQDLWAALTERAYDAERHLRALIHDTLTALNELRDTGELERAARDVLDGGEARANEVLADAPLRAAEVCGLPQSRVTELAPDWQDLSVRLEGSTARLVVAPPTGTGGEGHYSFRLISDSGDRGRVSTRDFFSPDPERRFGGVLPSAPADEPRDLYSAALTSLAWSKNEMYAHARRVEELGPTERSGAGLAAGVGLFLMAVGAVVFALGLKDNNHEAMIWGAIIFAAGACVAAGKCAAFLTKKGISVPLTPP